MSDAPATQNADASAEPPRVEQDRQLINQARQEGTGSLFWAFTKLSGPGWLQSAITLGGGSLGGSLYLGVLAGFGLMWLQPLAMIMGVIMLSAIGYVALSTGERPFQAINNHVNPVLGWAWAIATLMANMVWCMPQFTLGSAALKQNLLPGVLGEGALGELSANFVCVAILLGTAGTIVWFYDSGGKGIKIFEWILKAMVGLVVICFFGVVVKMTLSSQGLDWAAILKGFVPNFSLLSEPSPAFADPLAQTGAFADFWKNLIVTDQQKVMITAAATAVGINMTFLLPYSMLQKGWDRDFRGLAIFDLATALFIPFVLATSCVVIAAATQFHAQPEPGLVDNLAEPGDKVVGGYNGLLDKRLSVEHEAEVKALKAEISSDDEAASATATAKLQLMRDALPIGDRTMAAMIVKRDAFNLANSLKNLVGEGTAQYVFGLGVLAMAVSTIIILMLINGFVVCEMLGLPSHGTAHRVGCYLAGFSGALGPFIWSKAGFWLAVPTSMFGMCLLPIAYVSFLFMMNSKSLLGDNMPTGAHRVRWNVLMGIATALATFGAYWSIKTSGHATAGYTAMGVLIGLAVIVQVTRKGHGA